MQSQHYPLNTLFKPSLSMKMWYRGGIALIFGLILLFTYVPLVLFAEMPAVFSGRYPPGDSHPVCPAVVLGRSLLREHVVRAS